MVAVISPEHTAILSGAGYHEDRIKGLPFEVDLDDDSAFVPTVKDPIDLIVVVAGGVPGPISAIMSGWTGASRPVTKAFEA
jgi:hypothetical protein